MSGGVRRLGPLILALALLEACVAPSEPPPPPAPVPPPPAPPPPPPAPADWRDRDYSQGDWSYAAGEARYGTSVVLRCDRAAGQVALDLPGASAGRVTVRTSYGDTARQAQPVGAGLRLALPTGDPLLEQMAFSRGRFMLAAGAQELILPAWPEIARVVEDCR